MIQKIKHIAKKLIGPIRVLFNKDLSIEIERSWSTDMAIGIKGHVMAKNCNFDSLEVTIDDITIPVTKWLNGPDNHPRKFWVQVPRVAQHQALFTITQKDRKWSRRLQFEGSPPVKPTSFTDGSEIFNDFVRRVNQEQLHVLEIGSRVLSGKSQGMRSTFSGAASYVGFDYYPDSNTDVVGDAHQLSSYFPEKKFDAVFSMAVFEHIAMPWVVAMEINKVLKKGGITCHLVPFAWPAHEQPWDFWRCSDEGLKVLFSTAMGFQTIDAGMSDPLRMHFDTLKPKQAAFPEVPCFGCSTILSEKVSEIDQDKFRWDVSIKNVLGDESHYPKH